MAHCVIQCINKWLKVARNYSACSKVIKFSMREIFAFAESAVNFDYWKIEQILHFNESLTMTYRLNSTLVLDFSDALYSRADFELHI